MKAKQNWSRTAGIIGIVGTLAGCSSSSSFDFDEAKAYHYSRAGIMAGGSCDITFDQEGIVTYYSYTKKPAKGSLGMNDLGADVYFVGLKEGTVEVTVTMNYPTTSPQVSSFTLAVDSSLKVTAKE